MSETPYTLQNTKNAYIELRSMIDFCLEGRNEKERLVGLAILTTWLREHCYICGIQLPELPDGNWAMTAICEVCNSEPDPEINRPI